MVGFHHGFHQIDVEIWKVGQNNELQLRFQATISSGEASSDELVMQNSLRMRKHDPACAMHSCSKSMSYQPIFTSCINTSIYEYFLLLRYSAEVKLPLPRQISSQYRILS